MIFAYHDVRRIYTFLTRARTELAVAQSQDKQAAICSGLDAQESTAEFCRVRGEAAAFYDAGAKVAVVTPNDKLRALFSQPRDFLKPEPSFLGASF
ncbi:hypothetical protein [Mesorhizobium sp. M0047]|uniref:hypothetical protein n=1 Tax=unclassified Mesorhizobium TaxID=325217 RepID=UPI00333A86F2